MLIKLISQLKLFLLLLISIGEVSANNIKVWALDPDPENPKISAVWQEISTSFEKNYPDINLNITLRSTDDHKKAMESIDSEEDIPDIYFMWAGPGLGGEYINANFAKNMDDYYQQYGWDKILIPSATSFSELYYGGRYGVPFTLRGEAIFYNKALFAKAGIDTLPSTYLELKETAKLLKDIGVMPITFGGAVNWHLMRLMDVILESLCSVKAHDDLKKTIASWSEEPCAKESFKEFQEWTNNYVYSPFMELDYVQSLGIFKAEKAAMILEGDWITSNLKKSNIDNKFDIFPFPTNSFRMYGFSEYLYISSNSKNADHAAKFLNYLISDSVQQKYRGVFGVLSVNVNVSYSDLSPLEQKWRSFFEHFDTIFLNGDQAFTETQTEHYFKVLNQVAENEISPSEAVNSMQQFIDKNRISLK